MSRLHLSPDGRETLEDALRIFEETAGEPEGRRERIAASEALVKELEQQQPPEFAWLQPTAERVKRANDWLATRTPVPEPPPALELLDELQDAAGALVDEIAMRRGVATGELGVGALLTLKQPPVVKAAAELIEGYRGGAGNPRARFETLEHELERLGALEPLPEQEASDDA